MKDAYMICGIPESNLPKTYGVFPQSQVLYASRKDLIPQPVSGRTFKTSFPAATFFCPNKKDAGENPRRPVNAAYPMFTQVSLPTLPVQEWVLAASMIS